MQNGIPFYDVGLNDMLSNDLVQKEIYDQFFNVGGAGCIGFKNIFRPETMQAYNRWCENYLDVAKNHENCRHPKQKDKIVINNVLEAMSESNPGLSDVSMVIRFLPFSVLGEFVIIVLF